MNGSPPAWPTTTRGPGGGISPAQHPSAAWPRSEACWEPARGCSRGLGWSCAPQIGARDLRLCSERWIMFTNSRYRLITYDHGTRYWNQIALPCIASRENISSSLRGCSDKIFQELDPCPKVIGKEAPPDFQNLRFWVQLLVSIDTALLLQWSLSGFPVTSNMVWNHKVKLFGLIFQSE